MRAAAWLGLSVPAAVFVMLLMLPQSDLVFRFSTPRVLSEEVFALATGVLAAIAAFTSIVPGYNRKLLVLPLVPLVLWLVALGQDGIREWLQLTTHGFSFRAEWHCLPAMVIAGAVPAVAMATMLRRGAPLTPRVTALLGGLAAAGLGNLGACVTHHEFGNVLVLVWHMSIVVLLSLIAGSVGRSFLNWRAIVITPGRVNRLSSGDNMK